MKKIFLGFSNMWGASEAFTESYFLKCFPYLAPHYQFNIAPRLSKRNPDFVFYSVYGYIENPRYGLTKILFSGECGDHFAEGGKIAPGVCEPGFFDYGLTMAAENTHPNHIYMPLACLHLPLYNNGITTLIRDGSPPPAKEFFCDFIYSNGNSRVRVDFMKLLARRKRVECAGAVERNTEELRGTGYDRGGYLAKQRFQARCRFSIAFENNYFPGYTSEKLSDPLVARSVPIYSGNPRVAEVFNPEAFINVDEFPSHDAAIDYILKVDADEAWYQRYLNAPPFRGNVVPEKFSDATYLKFFQRIFQ
jgi:hypothetical protein